ncbi:MAG: hypothetical protein RLY71_3662 [Pseudomonadota bacterium]|jgi:uncharacterized protein (DUF1501 family)
MKSHHMSHNVSRRNFLRRSAQLGALAGSPFALNLAAIGSAAALVNPGSDYKALVCVYLLGGNDQSNTVVPCEGSAYTDYQAARPSIALTQASLLPLSLQNHTGPRLGLNPSLATLKPLIDAGSCALMANVGTLVEPTTLAQYKAGTARLPQGLFSHSDQMGAWQTGLPDRPSATGWFGRMADLLAPVHATTVVPMAVSVAGNNALQAGADTVQYQVTTNGPVTIDTITPTHWRYSKAMAPTLTQQLTEPRDHLLESAFTTIGARSIAAGRVTAAALAGSVTPTTVFPGTAIGQQLRMVARMISARGGLGQSRQVFYVTHGGYDFHDTLVASQNARLKELADALAAFQAAMVELGVAPNVTAFTASDFGRGLQTNGRGSDHGWGAHHFVLGGAVWGNRIYGQWPTVRLGGPEDAGQGRLLPTTSVDQYAATLATWFGVDVSLLPDVLPNLSRFAVPTSSSLGFLG